MLELLGPWLAENLVDQRFSKSGIQEGLQVKAFEEESGGAKKAINPSNKHLLHPYLGFSQNPNANFQANGLGFFGPLPNNEKNENQFNIYITGGSVAKQTFASNRILKEELKKHPFFNGKKIQVLCLAMGGYKQPQQLLALNYLLFLDAPIDMVINLDGFNEIALPYTEGRRQATYPFYPRNWANFAQSYSNPQFHDYRLEGKKLVEKRINLIQFYTKSWLRHSYFALLIGKTKLASINNRILRVNEKMKAAITSKEHDFQSQGPAYEYQEESIYFQDFVDKWKQASIMMDQICRANDIPYFHFLQPNQYVKGSKVLTEEENKIANILSTNRKKGAQYNYMQAVTKSYHLLQETGLSLKNDHGVAFTDLTMIFKEEKEAVYADFCCHFNPYGIQQINKEIASHILEKW